MPYGHKVIKVSRDFWVKQAKIVYSEKNQWLTLHVSGGWEVAGSTGKGHKATFSDENIPYFGRAVDYT